MGGCCNAKTLSYVSAGVQIAASVILIVGVTLVAARAGMEGLDEVFGSATTFFVIFGALCLLNLAILVTLIMGIKQNRITLVKIYLYPNIVMTVLSALWIFASFVLGFVYQLPVGLVFIKFFADVLRLGLSILILSPIFMHFTRMRVTPDMSVTYRFCKNQPIQNLQTCA